MKNQEKQNRNLTKQISFPVIDVLCCPRYYKGLIVADGRAPLSKYIPAVTANNFRNIIQNQTPQKYEITSLKPSDGLLYFLGKTKFNQLQQTEKNIKIVICVCLYNQSKNALEITLNGIYSNLVHLRQNGITQHDIAVIIVQDGILKLVKNKKNRQYLHDQNSIVEFYRNLDKRQKKQKCAVQERINTILDEIENFSRKGMEQFVINNQNFPPSIDKNISLLYQNLWSPNQSDQTKLKIITCFKHLNGTKLSSHLWFFQGFCRYIKPQFCVLLDVGTKPAPNSILPLLEAFVDQNVGGTTGFMSVDANFSTEDQQTQQAKNFCVSTLFSIQKAQQFQYIISHFIDKSFESSLGFLHVLPGAWSAYRYEALIHGQKFQQNLLQRKYFKMLLDPNEQQRDYRQANMYLAEDRILSLGIYCQQDRNYYLKYVPNAFAFTDPMKSHEKLMTQRRRWINSSYFAFIYVFRNFYYNVAQSKHNFIRKYFALVFNMLIALITVLNGYFIPAFYCFALYTTIVQIGSHFIIQIIAQLLTMVYIFTVIISIAWSLHGKQWTKKAHIISYVFSFYTFFLLGLVIYNIFIVYLQVTTLQNYLDIFQDKQTFLVFVIICINIGGYILIALIHFPTHLVYLWRLLVCSVSYLVYQGAYSHVMLIYAFCNVDDISWGTKGNNDASKNKKYTIEKMFFLAKWLFYNGLLAFCFIYIDFFTPRQTKKGLMLLAIGIYSTTIFAIKVSLAFFHQIKWIVFERCCRGLKVNLQRQQKMKQQWDKFCTAQINNHILYQQQQ